MRSRWCCAEVDDGVATLEAGDNGAAHLPALHGNSADADPAGLDDSEVGGRRTGVRRVRRPTKRKQEDDSSPPPQGPPSREPGPPFQMNGEGLNMDREPPQKRRRAPPPLHGASAEQIRIHKLRLQYETVMQGLLDGSSLISGIFHRASERIQAMIVDIAIDTTDAAGQSTLNYAMQVC